MSAGVGERLEGKRIVICAGSGGVGKTTTSAALAMGLAAQGLRVAVVTIDPAGGWRTRSGWTSSTTSRGSSTPPASPATGSRSAASCGP